VSYTLAKSIDDVSSIGGSAVVVAQNDQDLAAERGLSSFDQRHRFSGNATYDLPFGENKRWFQAGAGAALLGHWQLNTSVQVDPDPSEQRVQHRAIRVDRHGRQLANLRRGNGVPADAARADRDAGQVLIGRASRSTRKFVFSRLVCPSIWIALLASAVSPRAQT